MLHVIINTDNEEEVLAQRVEQSLHGGNGGAGCYKIIKDDEVRLLGQGAKIEIHRYTLTRVSNSHILVIGDLQPAAYLGSYTASKVLSEVPSFRRSTDSPRRILHATRKSASSGLVVAAVPPFPTTNLTVCCGGPKMIAEHTLDNGRKVVSKIDNHRVVGFDVC